MLNIDSNTRKLLFIFHCEFRLIDCVHNKFNISAKIRLLFPE